MNEQLKYLSPEWFKAEAPKYAEIEIEKQNRRQQFCDEFSLEKLRALSGKSLLDKIFYSDNDTNDSLCYIIERGSICKGFGGINGGSAYKFGLFFHKGRQCWHSGSSKKPQELTESEAIAKGTEIRDKIVAGAKIINYEELDTIEKYEKISKELKSAAVPEQMWIMKYYHILYPHIIPEFYSDDWQKHVLYALNIIPHTDSIVRMGQIALFMKKCNISSIIFSNIIYANVGRIKTFYRIGTGDNGEFWDMWKENNYAAIGWSEIGDLSEFIDENNNFKKDELVNELMDTYDYNKGVASKTANQMIAFCDSKSNNTYVVAEHGKELLGIGAIDSDYYFDENQEYKHCRNVQWKWINDNNISLPNSNEGLNTTYYRLNDDGNLCYLYNAILHDTPDTPDIPNTVMPKELTNYNKEQFLSEVFIKESEFDKLASLLKNKKNIILQGAPGVGKTFAAKRLAYALMGVKDDARIQMVQFHQSYSYEDFIEGYRPNETGGFDLRDGVFKEFCDAASKDTNKDYFFIIDEINRGNLSKIFGELLMLIEADKRGNDYSVNLVYSNKKLSLPENLYIIGMMNTADRSLAMIDYALRRRFAFYTMIPAFENKTFDNKYSVVECEMFHKAIKAIRNLNEVISKDRSLGKGFEIGHSYFCVDNPDKINDIFVKNIIEYEIIPTIEEYWFDNETVLDTERKKLEALLSYGE